jgi:uncharacterized tellurite resistance protein B-like protein
MAYQREVSERAMTYLGALVMVGRADGELCAEERAWLRHVARSRFAIDLDDETLFSSDALWEEACGARLDGNLRAALIEDAVVLAISDGALDAAEERVIVELADAIGVPRDDLAATLARLRA